MLSKFEKESLYFIEVNHMLEHCENPLGTINAHLQRLKVGGVCFHSIPDKRFSFDCDREKTEFDHLVHGSEVDPESSRTHHYVEWVKKVCKISVLDDEIKNFKWHGGLTDSLIDQNVDSLTPDQLRVMLDDMNYIIHFHVWDYDSFSKLLIRARTYLDNIYRIKKLVLNQTEIIVVLQKIIMKSKTKFV